MDDFCIDARRWRFLDRPDQYVASKSSKLKIEPLKRQFKTANAILSRLVEGHGVLLADDVGLGKTTVAALVAWVLACQEKRVRIYAPNEYLRRRWAEELELHAELLGKHGASPSRLRQGAVDKLKAGRIQIATHAELVRSHGDNERRTACDLMIIDEAHRAKGEGSAFHKALRELGDLAKRKLILTATPFSIQLAELERLLQFVGAPDLEAVRRYANELHRLYSLGRGYNALEESARLVQAAKGAVAALQPYVIRHGIDDLSPLEQRHFGEVGRRWEIPTRQAADHEIELLLRTDRVLKLAPERKGERRIDPRFHVGWRHVGTELARAAIRTTGTIDHAVRRHIQAANESLCRLRVQAHPKAQSVSEAIRAVVDAGEKVLVFCHHRASACELLEVLEQSLRSPSLGIGGPPEAVWREAWDNLLTFESILKRPIMDWLCSPGLRSQIGLWLGRPAKNTKELETQLTTLKPRGGGPHQPTIHEAAMAFSEAILRKGSTSTRALLRSIAQTSRSFGGSASHFPGRLDEGFRVMGTWDPEDNVPSPATLYTGKPDIVLALFNSPFGPDVLVTTDRLSEGVDLHRCCRYLIHYELDPSPVRTLQRNGRLRRVDSWAAHTGKPIQYAYPTFGGTRDERAVAIMKQRISAFGLLLGGVPTMEEHNGDREQRFADEVVQLARRELETLNRRLHVQVEGEGR